jgi:hypothetical protein
MVNKNVVCETAFGYPAERSSACNTSCAPVRAVWRICFRETSVCQCQQIWYTLDATCLPSNSGASAPNAVPPTNPVVIFPPLRNRPSVKSLLRACQRDTAGKKQVHISCAPVLWQHDLAAIWGHVLRTVLSTASETLSTISDVSGYCHTCNLRL